MNILGSAALVMTVLVLAVIAQQTSAQASGISTLLALRATLSELQVVIDRTQVGLDSMSAAKLEAASNEAERLLREVDKIRRGTVKDVNEAIQEVARQTQQLTASLRKTISQTERRVFLDVNTALANVSQSLDGIPLVRVRPHVAAIEPSRLRPNATNRRIAIYGYFPDAKDGRRAEVSLAGVTIPLTREAGAKYSFDLPAGLALKEETFIDLSISVPKRSGLFGLWKSFDRFSDRIYVERLLPFTCETQIRDPNPALDQTVQASIEFTDEARTQAGGGKAKQHPNAVCKGSVHRYSS